METIKEFLSLNGINEADLILDGHIQSIKEGKFNGWYVGDKLGPGEITLTIEDWRTRDRHTFIEGMDPNDPAVKEKLRASHDKYEQEKKDLQALKKKHAQQDWKKFQAEFLHAAQSTSKYLLNKHLENNTFGALQMPSDAVGTDVVVPIFDQSFELCNLQTIQESGFKSFIPGALIEGCFYMLRGPHHGEPKTEMFICEGFATACTIQMAMPESLVVCAFFADNLKSVAEFMRAKHPDLAIMIAADDDWKLDENVGLRKAEEAARSIAATVTWPVFHGIRGRDWTDWNDLHAHGNLDTVKAQLEATERRIPEAKWSEAFAEAKHQETLGTKQSEKAADAHMKRADALSTVAPFINGVQPLEMRLAKNGQPIIPPEFTAAVALYKYYEHRTVVCESSIFMYDGKHWKEVDELSEATLRLKIQVLYNGLVGQGKVKNTFEMFKDLLPASPINLFAPNPYKVNFLNGTIHVLKKENKWTFEFRPHDPKDFCTHLIPINYDETRTIRNSRFEEMLDRIFEGQADREDKIKAIKQMYGACVAPIFPHLFMIYGPGGSGKTSIIMPAQKLIDKDNWSSVEPHEFEGFKMESMAGKLVNIVTDIDLTEPIADNHIKKIEDRVPVRIDRKFKNAILVPLPAIHIFGGNDIPATFEKGSNAHERRWTFIHVEGFKAQGQYSKFFANEVFDSCPEGVLNFALEGLSEVLDANGHYHTPDSGKQKMRRWQMEHDPIALFVQEIADAEIPGWSLKSEGRVLRSTVWSVFVKWYEEAYNRKPRIGKTKFYEALLREHAAGAKLEIRIYEGMRYIVGLCVGEKVDPEGRH